MNWKVNYKKKELFWQIQMLEGLSKIFWRFKKILIYFPLLCKIFSKKVKIRISYKVIIHATHGNIYIYTSACKQNKTYLGHLMTTNEFIIYNVNYK